MKKQILKSNKGLIQLIECPKCGYMVKEIDIIWEKRPKINNLEAGKIEMCRFCKENP